MPRPIINQPTNKGGKLYIEPEEKILISILVISSGQYGWNKWEFFYSTNYRDVVFTFIRAAVCGNNNIGARRSRKLKLLENHRSCRKHMTYLVLYTYFSIERTTSEECSVFVKFDNIALIRLHLIFC